MGVVGGVGDNGGVSQPTEQRPPQVTLASSIVMFASVMVLFRVEQVSTLGTLETQEAIRAFLGEAPFSSLGLDVTAASELLRIACMVAAAAACATGVLGLVRPQARPLRTARAHLLRRPGLRDRARRGRPGRLVRRRRHGHAVDRPGPRVVRHRALDAAGARARRAGARPAAYDPRRARLRVVPPLPPAPDAGPPPATRPFGEPVGATHSPYGQPLAPETAPAPRAATPQQLRTRPGAMVAAFVITVVTAGGLLGLSLLWLAIAGLSPDFLMSVLEQQQP